MDVQSLELLIKLLDGTDKIQRFALLLTFRLEKGPFAFARFLPRIVLPARLRNPHH